MSCPELAEGITAHHAVIVGTLISRSPRTSFWAEPSRPSFWAEPGPEPRYFVFSSPRTKPRVPRPSQHLAMGGMVNLACPIYAVLSHEWDPLRPSGTEPFPAVPSVILSPTIPSVIQFVILG